MNWEDVYLNENDWSNPKWREEPAKKTKFKPRQVEMYERICKTCGRPVFQQAKNPCICGPFDHGKKSPS